ncbi:MAG: hypothetical protein V1729_06480 [Candidatus Woesearchaeota archaeon]
MAIEFNPDGSIKLPTKMASRRIAQDNTFDNYPCVRVTRDQISHSTPLKCDLIVDVSPKFMYPNRIETMYEFARDRFPHEANMKMVKEGNRRYVISIISGRLRCSWCQAFRNHLQNNLECRFLQGGSCSRS